MAEATAEQTDADRTVVYLGNRQAINRAEDTIDKGKFCTTVRFPPERGLLEAVNDIMGPAGIWAHMSAAPAPAWVAAEGPLAEAVTMLLAAHYRCEIREPEPAEV